jgi:hypothetical protein
LLVDGLGRRLRLLGRVDVRGLGLYRHGRWRVLRLLWRVLRLLWLRSGVLLLRLLAHRGALLRLGNS